MEHHDSHHHQNLHEDDGIVEHVHDGDIVNYVSTGWFNTAFAEIPENDYIYTPIEIREQPISFLQEIEQ